MAAPSVVAAGATCDINTKATVITVTPTVRRPGLYDACPRWRLRYCHRFRQPFFDSARQLLDLGHDPTTVLVMRHAGSDTDALTGRIGAAAKLRVKGSRKGPPRFVAWDPPRRVEALARARAERVTGVADGRTNEGNMRPGAIVATESRSVPVSMPSRHKASRG